MSGFHTAASDPVAHARASVLDTGASTFRQNGARSFTLPSPLYPCCSTWERFFKKKAEFGTGGGWEMGWI